MDDLIHLLMYGSGPLNKFKVNVLGENYSYADYLKAIKSDIYTIKGVPHGKKFVTKQLKHKMENDGLDVDVLQISSPYIIIGGDFDKEDLSEIMHISVDAIKTIPGTDKFYIIDLSKHTPKIGLALLEAIHKIGVKYISGEKLTCEFIDKNIEYLQNEIDMWLAASELDAQHCIVDIEDHNLALAFSSMIPKNVICQELGLDEEIFIEVSNPYETVLVCSCPRIVFEEFFDKQEDSDSAGADKWLI